MSKRKRHKEHTEPHKKGFKVVRHIKVDKDRKVVMKKNEFLKTLTVLVGIAFVIFVLILALKRPAEDEDSLKENLMEELSVDSEAGKESKEISKNIEEIESSLDKINEIVGGE